jgi:hypothetical protein
LINAIVRRFVPPASREHVLGDLWERYRSPGQFLTDAVRAVPFVVGSQIRRAVDPVLLALQATMVFGGLGGFRPVSATGDGPGWTLALAPTVVAAMVLALCDAYRTLERRPSWRYALSDAVLTSGAVLLAHVAMQWVLSGAGVSLRQSLAGAVVTFAIVVVGRICLPLERDVRQHAARGQMTPDEFARDVEQFRRMVHRRNRNELQASAVVSVVFLLVAWRTPEPVARIGFGLVVAAALFIMYFIWTRGTSPTVPLPAGLPEAVTAYRQELAHQRDLLRNIGWWYLLPFLPGVAVFIVAGVQARPDGVPLPWGMLGFFVLIGTLVYYLNQRAARRLQTKIDSLSVVPSP